MNRAPARAEHRRRAQGAAAPGQARPLPGHPARAARPGPHRAAAATPSSWSSSSPTRSPAATPARPSCAPAPPGSTPPCAWTPWDTDTAVQLRPRALERTVLAAVPRRRPRRLHPRPRRGRQDPPGHRPRTHRDPAPAHACWFARADQLFRTAQGRPARQQPRSRDAPAGPRRPAHHRRLRAASAGRHRDRRLLRTHRRTPPEDRPPSSPPTATRRVARADERPAARPVRRSTGSSPPATNSSSKASPTAADNAPATPANPPTGASCIDQTRRTDDHHIHAQVVPRSWQRGGPITLASDKRVHGVGAWPDLGPRHGGLHEPRRCGEARLPKDAPTVHVVQLDLNM